MDLEQAFIGSLIQAPNRMVQVLDIVTASDLAGDEAKRAFVIISSLWKNREHVDLVSVAAGDMTLASYLATATSSGTPIAVLDHAKRVARQARERRVATSLSDLLNSREPVEMKLDELLSIYNRERAVSAKPAAIKDVLGRFNKQQAENSRHKRLGVPTGFGFLEEKYIQYVPGHIWVLGAYTSVGKTAMMVQKVCNLLAMDRCPAIQIVSTEMTEEQVVARILGNYTAVHPFRILSGNYRQGEEEIVEQYKALIQDKPLYIHDDVYKVGDIEQIFRRAHLQGGVGVGFIDYVQNCRIPGAQSSYQEQSEMAKIFQSLAKAARCTLVCLSQVSNDVGRGTTDQLEYKGAGEWAAVADVGIHLQRSKADKYALLYGIKKHRHGPLLEQRFEYKADYTRLEPLEA